MAPGTERAELECAVVWCRVGEAHRVHDDVDEPLLHVAHAHDLAADVAVGDELLDAVQSHLRVRRRSRVGGPPQQAPRRAGWRCRADATIGAAAPP